MYLSKLEIIGFKSFAQKVFLTFDSGISAIVGPNGCGKTNIVDSIRWVLGEQRYSALRSEKMEDVIFNGTKQRKPLGMAEVSLVIENTKGILPSEYTQVTVTRRVFRSGESEYLLNKVPCRLKDILDLFMDTGMGADAYSVIELKMIETILSDKTDERRHLFEEAAGVTKYKHRRKAAYRKLESVQADLLRVNDIITEVQKAVNSLERQARKAEQFQEIKERLRGLEVDLMEREFAQLNARSQPLAAKLSAGQQERAGVDNLLASNEKTLEDLRARMLEIDQRLAAAVDGVTGARERIQRVEEKNLVAAERTKALQENIERFEEEDRTLTAEQERVQTARNALEQRMDSLRSEESRLMEELDRRQAGLRDATDRLESKKSELQSQNDRMIELVRAIADGETGAGKRKARLSDLQERIARATEDITAYEKETDSLAGSIATLSAEDKQLRRSYTEAEMALYEAETQKSKLRERLESLQREASEIRSDMGRRSAKADFLKGLMESREGLSDGVRHLTGSDRWRTRRKGTVADAVHAEQRYRAAIEAALGEFTNLLIVDSSQEADDGIAILMQDQRGKASFVSLDRIPDVHTRVRIPPMKGICGWAVSLAKYDPALTPLFRILLDRVLVVDTLGTARSVLMRVSGIRCVTLSGEIVTSIGLVRGGSLRYDEGGTIGKTQQIEELQTEVTSLATRLSETEQAMRDVLGQHDAIDLKSRSESVKAVEREMNAVEMRIAQLEFEKKRAGDSIARNRELIDELSAEAGQLEVSITADAPMLDRLREEHHATEQSLSVLTHAREELESEWNERSRLVSDGELGAVRVAGDMQNAQSEEGRMESRMREIKEAMERYRAEVQRARADISATEASVGGNLKEVIELQKALAAAQEHRDAVEQELNESRDRAHATELKIKDLRRTHDDMLAGIHDLEMKIADLQAKADHIRARAQEEFEVTVELKSYPEDEFVDFASLREQIQVLRDKVKTLGNINFAAFEEYKAEKERFEFLSGQRKDLLEAEKTLLATIEEINNTAQTKFLETFALIRKNFIETFKSLFDPGDECDLRLEEGVDPLEAAIDIIAKPRGKRPTSIDLLSGGEKTLTAIALLFAIYLVKPSPFCILDEVDAPLDDANIDRFTRILTKFSDNTQFIVVTHNKRTMEAASALYGVTMEEEGISKLVTVRFNQGAAVQSAALASA